MQPKENKPLTTGEIAGYCHVTLRAVSGWVSDGKLKAYRTPGRHGRVHRDDFIRFLNQYDMPIPKEFGDHQIPEKRILIVDDDLTMTKTLLHILDKENKYVVDVAYDGFSAGFKFAAHKPDLITLDLRMPMMDGYKVCSMIREDHSNDRVKIIAISSFEDENAIENILSLGADDYMVKPISRELFLEKIEEMVR